MNIQLAHQVELMGLDGFDAEIEGGGDLLDRLAFGEHLENFAFAFGEGAEARLADRLSPLSAEIVHQASEDAG